MIESIKISNLRAITNLEFKNFGQVNLLIGQNNCGKTTTLEGLFCLLGGTIPDLIVTINNLRGFPFISNDVWSTYFHNKKIVNPIEITGKTSNVNEEHRLSIRPLFMEKKETHVVSTHFVTIEKDNQSSVHDDLTGLELVYSNSINKKLSNTSRIYTKGRDVKTEGKKEPPPFNAFYINPSTILSNLKDRFGKAQRAKKVDRLVDALKQIDSHIIDLRLNEIGVVEADIDLPGLIPVNLLGGGVAKVLSVALALCNYSNGIVLIDEIENGLHYSAQEILWKTIFKTAEENNIQVFATTHSYECLKAFSACSKASLFKKQSKVFRIERKGEMFKSIELNADELETSLRNNWEIR